MWLLLLVLLVLLAAAVMFRAWASQQVPPGSCYWQLHGS
jgi:hypothetical protein